MPGVNVTRYDITGDAYLNGTPEDDRFDLSSLTGGFIDLTTGLGSDTVSLYQKGGIAYIHTSSTFEDADDIGDLVTLTSDTMVSARADVRTGSGNDTIQAGDYYGRASLDGGEGDDVIVARLEPIFRDAGYVSGGGGKDFISVEINGRAGINGGAGTLGGDPLDGNDRILITGNDRGDFFATGAGGDDLIDATASAGRYTLHGGKGSDTITSSDGANTIYGGLGSDMIDSRGGDDVIYGGTGEVSPDDLGDTIEAGSGKDTIYGNAGDDQLFGNEDDDLIFGGQGNDFLYGGMGNDTLTGGVGNDTLNGGVGADRFVFAQGSGNDRVEGFNSAEGDRIDVSGQSFTTSTAGSDLLISFADGSTITLVGVPNGSPFLV